MKSYTDLKQSKKLAEILPTESADMYYCYGMDIHTKKWGYDIVSTIIDASNQIDISDIPCWSLSALLSVLPYPDIKQRYDGKWICRVENKDTTYLWVDDSPIDACVAIIEKLHEQKLL